MKPLIAYCRVSTERQRKAKDGKSRGLGLDAQRAAVAKYAESVGGTIVPGGEYEEIESGRRNDRPELARAVARARACRGTVVVAKLDRIARDAKFLLQLIDAGVALHFCDLPQIDASDPIIGRLIITIMAALAEFEAKRIAERIRDALAIRKKRGVKLGAANPQGGRGFLLNGKQKMGSKAASIARSKRAAEFRAMIHPVIEELKQQGHQTLAQLAFALNESGYKTRSGKPWTEQRVHSVMEDHS